MLDDPFSPLSLIAGPAILTNACAVMQNGATTRYNLAITQFRQFRDSVAARDDKLSLQYVDPHSALMLAERRLRLQIGGLDMLNAAVALFAATTAIGLGGSFLVQIRYFPAVPVSLAIVLVGAAALLLLLGSTVTFFLEGACGRALMNLHRRASEPVLPEQLQWSFRRDGG